MLEFAFLSNNEDVDNIRIAYQLCVIMSLRSGFSDE